MSKKKSNLIETLHRFTIDTYHESLQDIKLLHEIEWSNNPNTFSILGEAEVWSSSVVGLAQQLTRHMASPLPDLSKGLRSLELFGNQTISDWIWHEGLNYKRFLNHLLSVECLRVSALKELENNSLA